MDSAEQKSLIPETAAKTLEGDIRSLVRGNRPADAPVSSLMDIFNRGMVAIVMDGSAFLGLVTRIDLLNWLRRRLEA